MVSTVNSWLSFLDHPIVDTTLDALILFIGFIPAFWFSARMLLGDHSVAQKILRSPMVMSWLMLFCGLEIAFHIMKVPVLLKVLVVLIGIIISPLIIIAAVIHEFTPL